MRHFLFEDSKKEYRFNPRYRRQRKEQDSAMALARLLRKFRSSSSSKKTSFDNFIKQSGGSRRADTRQKCVVKMQYSNSMASHKLQIDYLSREGTDVDGGRAKLYGTDLEEYRKNMVDMNFRIFLSPQSDKVNLNTLAETFIKKLEQQTGYSFYFQAANHYNTAHPHAHLLINGKDKNGKEVKIPRDIVKTFMRENACDICTEQLGHRTKAEIAIEKEMALTAGRFTRMDERIKSLCSGSSINLSHVVTDRKRVLTRLEHLRKLGLCNYTNNAYQFTEGWEETLRTNARYNTFLQARGELKYSNPMNFKVYSGEDGFIKGKVTKVYRTEDDASDNHAVIIECPDGKAYFVPLFKKPEMSVGKPRAALVDGKIIYKKDKAAVSEGDVVSIRTYENQRGRLTPVITQINENDLRGTGRKNTGGFNANNN